MSQLSILALIGYILSLAAAQTIYGTDFLIYRWYALMAFVTAVGADWVLARIRSQPQRTTNSSDILVLYLAATGITIMFAENWQFSGMRWTAHAIMLLAFMIFLRQTAGPSQVRLILLLLKASVASLLVISWLAPAGSRPSDLGYYRGAMGDSNTMGHIAFIASLLFFHAMITSKRGWPCYFQGALAFCAMATVWFTGARSSMIALLTGLLLLSYLYRQRLRSLVLWGFIGISLAALAFPGVPSGLLRFAVKRQDDRLTLTEQVLRTRRPLWIEAFDGFKERPIFGWGFGADKNIQARWEVKWTALGTVKRDAVNDVLLIMEGCGILGIVAYILLIYLVIQQWPKLRQRHMLKWYAPEQPGFTHNRDSPHHLHAILSILSLSILVLNQFDCSALSAGSFISVVLWASAGGAGALIVAASGAGGSLERSPAGYTIHD
jgi:O-antigen ligase